MNIFLDATAKLNRYKKTKFLGEGQYGNVYQAVDQQNNNIVAVKKIKCGSIQDTKDGINRTAIREIKYLKELHHENIIGLLDVYGEEDSINLVLEYLDLDLELVIKKSPVLDVSHVKNITIQMLEGLEHMHYQCILHRDMKPNNLFLSVKTGTVKIGDFGLTRALSTEPVTRPMTPQVCTIWYRSPELLLGCNAYGFGVDLWAVGCIIAEMFLRTALFPGNGGDLEQLGLIFEMIGAPTDENWPAYKNMKCSGMKFIAKGTPFNSLFTAVPPDMLGLMQKLLSHDPIRRQTSSDALQHPTFRLEPYHCGPREMSRVFQGAIDTDSQQTQQHAQASAKRNYVSAFGN